MPPIKTVGRVAFLATNDPQDRILKVLLPGSDAAGCGLATNDPQDRILKVESARNSPIVRYLLATNDPQDRILKVEFVKGFEVNFR